MKTFRNWIAVGLILIMGALAFPASTTAQVRLDLREANLRDFVAIVAESTGRNFILDPRVQGTVTVVSATEVSSAAVYEIFLNVLELNRLTIVEGGEADRIVPLDLARELTPAGFGGYETRVIPVKNVPVQEVIDVVRPLIPAEAVLTGVPESGLIILSDRLEGYQRIVKLVKKLDQPRNASIDTIRLRNAKASDLLAVIQALDLAPEGASLSADTRANAIVVSGDSTFRTRVRRLVSELDTPQRGSATVVVKLDYADASDLEPVVQKSFGASKGDGAASASDITIVAEPQQNALIVTGPSDRVQTIVASIRSLDARPSQVLIEAVVFELSVENFSDLSVQFGALLDAALVGGVEFSLQGRQTLTGVVGSVLSNTPASPGSGGTIGGGRIRNGNGILGFLSALASQSSTRLLSTPSILTLNNEEARIVVAKNVPFVTGSFSTVGDSAVPRDPFQTIERQDVGLTLEVTPQITADNNVRMRISQEVSNLTNTASAAGGEITSKRTLSTNALVRDDHVIILGGLVEDGNGSVSQGVPGLSRAPIIGGLFRGRNVSQSQRVLLIMLRPRILRTDAEVAGVTRAVAREARKVSQRIAPRDDGVFPKIPESRLPFDGANLDQPFEAGGMDPLVIERLMPALPKRLEFQD
ncbi:MAG: type II secretion system secretin GspD [Pseudooceanicola sp.]